MQDASRNGNVEITARKGGAGVYVFRNDNHAGASITAREDGGEAKVEGAKKSPGSGFPSGAYVKMGINENGGHVSVLGKGTDEARAVMAVNEYGNGAVSTWDKNGYRLALLSEGEVECRSASIHFDDRAKNAVVISLDTKKLIEAGISDNTLKAYRRALLELDAWLDAELNDPVLASYITELHQSGKAPASIAQVVAAVKWHVR